jgi:hypothetical protein
MKPLNGNIYLVTLLLFCLGTSKGIKAQTINGDTVYVDERTEVAIKFPSMPTNFYTNPADAAYNFKTLGNGFTIIAKSKNAKLAKLTVIESKRNHTFFLVYKKGINFLDLKETDHDYSTLKKLKDHVREREGLEADYTAAISLADTLFGAGDYVGAKMYYEKSLAIFNRPWPKDQIKKTRSLIAKQERKNRRNKKH